MEGKQMSLRRRASVVAAAVVALWSGNATAEVAVRVEAQPVADPIEVFVNVTNSAGAPVGGLPATDFAVKVDGVQVTAPTFSGGGNVSVVLAMDMSQSVRSAALASMQQAVIEFIGLMRIGDYAAVVMFNNTNPLKASVVQDFTAIDGAGNAGNTALEGAVMTPYTGSGSNILDGVTLSIQQLTAPSVPLPAGAKAIVLVSDGRDNSSTATLEGVVAAANAAGIPVFTIGVGDLTTTGATLLDDLASGTGAEYFPAPEDAQVAAAYQQISSRLNNEYLLTFTSPITDCNSHSLEVAVANNGSGTASFQRCTSTPPPPPPPPPADGGGGGGGGGATGLLELVLGATLVGLARRRRTLR